MRVTTLKNKEIQSVTGAIFSLITTLKQLPSHPDKPDYTGPLFTKINPVFTADTKHEGMLGSLMMDGLLGGVFAEAANDVSATPITGNAETLDLNMLVELASEYIEDRAPDRGEGKGSHATCKARVAANDFNESAMKRCLAAARTDAMAAYTQSLPERRKCEGALTSYIRKLENLMAAEAAPAPTPAFAA